MREGHSKTVLEFNWKGSKTFKKSTGWRKPVKFFNEKNRAIHISEYIGNPNIGGKY